MSFKVVTSELVIDLFAEALWVLELIDNEEYVEITVKSCYQWRFVGVDEGF